MKCPYCGKLDDKVIDSRSIKGGEAIRRRRECLNCAGRFTSYEHIDEVVRMVIKKDGRREAFDRNKVRAGLKKALEKRPVPSDKIEDIVDKIEAQVYSDKAEVPSKEMGEMILKILHKLDEVAYVRFASVYRQFSDINEFLLELKNMLGDPEKTEKKPSPEKNPKIIFPNSKKADK